MTATKDPSLVVELAKKFCNGVTPAGLVADAELVFDHLQALERENKIRALEHEVNQIQLFGEEVMRYDQAREWKPLEKLVAAFMQNFGSGVDDLRVRFSALRMTTAHAETMKLGQLSGASVKVFVEDLSGHIELLEEIARELKEEKALLKAKPNT